MATDDKEYTSENGVKISRHSVPVDYGSAISSVLDRVDNSRGAVLSSNYEYPGRYTRWDTAVVDPPLGIEGRGRIIEIIAYNKRGEVLLPGIYEFIKDHRHFARCELSATKIDLQIVSQADVFSEE